MGNNNSVSLCLAENETLIKSWTYAKTHGRESSTHDLIITDKRIIALENKRFSNGEKITRQEMRNDHVSALSVSAGIQRFLVLAIICLIIGIACLIAGIALISEIGGGAVSIIFAGVIFLIAAIYLFFKKQTMLTLVILSDTRNTNSLSIFASMGMKLKSKKGKLKVQVEANAAMQIVSEIGAILLTRD